MKLFVLGATGKTGQQFVRAALARNHTLVVVTRNNLDVAALAGGDASKAANVTIMRAALDDDATYDAMKGCDAVVSCLGLRRKSPQNPFSALTSPPDLMATSIARALMAMDKHGVQRIAVVSAGGVAESNSRVNLVFRTVINISKIGIAYVDMAVMERELRDSDRDWLAVRPVTLTDDPAIGNVVVVDRYALTATITRADVATYMLDQLDKPSPFANRTPMIANT